MGVGWFGLWCGKGTNLVGVFTGCCGYGWEVVVLL